MSATTRTGHTISHTFETHPTRPSAATAPADELMIIWQGLPDGSTAEIYLPRADAHAILALAVRTDTVHTLSLVDQHTIGVEITNATYLPLPAGSQRLAGLLTVTVPSGAKLHRDCRITIKQLTTAISVEQRDLHTPVMARTVSGAFSIRVQTTDRTALHDRVRHQLGICKWIQASTPLQSRWALPLTRYVNQLSQQYEQLGGNPHGVPPSPTGHDHDHDHDHRHDHDHDHRHDHDHDHDHDHRHDHDHDLDHDHRRDHDGDD